MAIKLLLLKSGEDMIADVSEMAYGEDDSRRVVGYYLNRPCILKMRVRVEHVRLDLKSLCSLGFPFLQKRLFLFHPTGL